MSRQYFKNKNVALGLLKKLRVLEQNSAENLVEMGEILVKLSKLSTAALFKDFIAYLGHNTRMITAIMRLGVQSEGWRHVCKRNGTNTRKFLKKHKNSSSNV